MAIWITKGLFIFVICIAEWNVCSNLDLNLGNNGTWQNLNNQSIFDVFMARNRVGIHSLYNVKDLPEQIPQGCYVIIIKGIERMVCISEYGIYLTIAKANTWQKTWQKL